MRAALAAVVAAAALLQGSRPATGAGGPLVYSSRPDDPWNQVFALLFTRDFQARFTSDFAERGPFESFPNGPVPPTPPLNVSTRKFDRHEDGDRAIEALYPMFLSDQGVRAVLEEPRHGELVRALTAAPSDRMPRTPLARALMQIDLWSAYDRLSPIQGPGGRYSADTPRTSELRSLIATAIGHLALTPAEISTLPDNYEAARVRLGLPDVLHGPAGWLEVTWAPFHVHEAAADQRRVARVFMRPRTPPSDVPSFLKAMTRGDPASGFAAAVLLVSPLLVDSAGHLVAAPLTTDVQMRTFARGGDGGIAATATEFELSRRDLLSDPSSGGLRRFDEASEAYLALAGNDYEFATPVFGQPSMTEPVVTTLRTRCSVCHGRANTGFMSLSVQDPDRLPPPRALPQPNDERARDVARQKAVRPEFTRLLALAGLR
jgi:hypothetical protein